MGEIADGVINGLFCIECQGIVDGEEPGFERTCDSCKGYRRKRKSKHKGKLNGQSRNK